MSPVRRLVLGSLAWLCVLVGAVVLSGAPAFAAAPEAPLFEVSSRKAVPAEEAVLRGVLYTGALGEPGSYEMLYRQSSSECQGGSKTPSGLVTGNQFEEVLQTITGLEVGKQYTACLALTSPGGTTLSKSVTFVAPIAVEVPTGLKAEPIAAFAATLRGTLSPSVERKAEPGSYKFVYRQSSSECEGEGQRTTPLTAAAGAKEEVVSAPVGELLPHTVYTFCLRASNEAGEVAMSAASTFTTLAGAPTVEETGVVGVSADSATFVAKIDPQGAETSYMFEYAPVGGAFVPVPGVEGKGSLVEGVAGVSVSAHLQGLSAHTAYEFRVVATNSVEAVTGASVSFTTQVPGGSFVLPDGREWEMVSPPQKEGSLILPIGGFDGGTGGIVQAAADGDAFEAMTLLESIEEKAAGAVAFLQSEFFGRGANGWASKTISPPASHAATYLNVLPDYHYFSRDLSKGLTFMQLGPFTALAPGVDQSTPYVHADYLNGDSGELCESNCFAPLVTEANNTPAGTSLEVNCENCGPRVEAATPDLSHIVLCIDCGLESERNQVKRQLYEWSAGRLVSLGEGYVPGGPNGGSTARHVISDDGARVFVGSEEALVMRDTITGETVQIAGSGGHFEAASSDGSKVFYTEKADEGKPELFEYNLNAPAGSRRTDLSVALNPGEQPEAASVLGVSEDGSYVYFAAGGVLAPGATPDSSCGDQNNGDSWKACNLYVYHEGVTKFVEGISGDDATSWIAEEGVLKSRVSPDGRWFAFMSNRDLTGYDTRDAVSARPDEEVYLYDARTSKIVCASCNPTGARPVGVEQGGNTQSRLVNKGGFAHFRTDTWIASSVPSWTVTGPYGEVSYQSRYLSDQGRLFFDSNDALVPQDVNGTQDVYQYEPPGVGDCASGKATFSGSSGGCVSLLSSGESGEESAFLDASETGGDVFFLTTSRLARQDFDNTFDIYDARECGSEGSRCFPRVAAGPPPCSTGDACKGAPSPQPSVFGSPASATFSGTGNATPPVSGGSAVKAKGLTRVQLLRRALRACVRKKAGRRRACERQARARYGAARGAGAIKGRGR